MKIAVCNLDYVRYLKGRGGMMPHSPPQMNTYGYWHIENAGHIEHQAGNLRNGHNFEVLHEVLQVIRGMPIEGFVASSGRGLDYFYCTSHERGLRAYCIASAASISYARWNWKDTRLVSVSNSARSKYRTLFLSGSLADWPQCGTITIKQRFDWDPGQAPPTLATRIC